MAFMILTVDIHMYLKAVYLLLFLVLLLIFYGLILVCFYTLGFKKRNTNGRDNPFEEDFDTVEHDDVDNERGSLIEQCTESKPADCRPIPTLHKQTIYNPHHWKTKNIFHEYYKGHNLLEIMCKNLCNKRNYKEFLFTKKVLLNLTKSNYLLSPGNHFERVVLPVHRQEEKPPSIGKEIEGSAGGCIDSKTKSRNSAEVDSTNGEGENPYHHLHGTKGGNEGDKEKGKEERPATSQNRNTDTGIIYDKENENIDDNTTSRNYTEEQVISNDVDNTQERGSLTTVNLQSCSDDDGVHSCLPNQGKAEPIEVHEDVIAARTGLRGLKGYPTESLAVQDVDGKILPLAPEEDFKEENDTSGRKLQPQLDDPSRKDQPHGPLVKLDVSGRKDQPQWPQPRLDVQSHKDQLQGPRQLMDDPGRNDKLPGQRPLMNDPVRIDQPPHLQTRLDDPGRKDRPPDVRVLMDDPGCKDRPRGTRLLMDDPCHKDQTSWLQPSHKNRPPGPRPQTDDPGRKDQPLSPLTRTDTQSHKDQAPCLRPLKNDPDCKDRPPDPRILIDDPSHKHQHPWQQTRLDAPSHKDQTLGPRLLIDDPDLKDRPPGPLLLMADPGRKDQHPWPGIRLDAPSHKDQPPGPRALMDDPGQKDKPPSPGRRLDNQSHKNQRPGPHLMMDDPRHKDQPQGPRPLTDDVSRKDQPPWPLTRLDSPGHKDQTQGQRPLMDDPSCKNLPPWPQPRSQRLVTGPNNQHPGSLSQPHRFGCQDQSQDLDSWHRLPVRQDQTPALSLHNCVSNNHEGRPVQGPVHHRERNTPSPHEESIMVIDLLLEQPPSLQNLQSQEDYHKPLDHMPLNGDLLNGIFHRLHEENQQVPVDNRYMEYGIVPDLITEPSPFINLNDYERLDPAHLILHQDHQVLHQGRQQRPHHDERRQRHLNEDFDGSTQRGPVIRVGNLRDCRTVYASRVSHGLRDGTVDENYYLDGQMMCVVCRNRPVGVQLHPCGHIVYCRMCVRSQPSCRQCGGLVEDYTNA